MSRYGDLYAYCQTLTPAICRNLIKDKVLGITGAPAIHIRATGLNEDLVYGYFLSGRNTEHPAVRQTHGPIIVVARGLNRCWKRFVIVKELMHMFDDPLEHTSAAADLETVLMNFLSPADISLTPQMLSEVRCFWMALACFCPESIRQDLQAKRVAGVTNDREIADALRIPEKFIPNLFHSRYKEVVGGLIL